MPGFPFLGADETPEDVALQRLRYGLLVCAVHVVLRWMTIRAPFNDFTAWFRGMPVADAAPVNTAEIKSFGLLIGDKQEGPFTLEIESIKAYSE